MKNNLMVMSVTLLCLMAFQKPTSTIYSYHLSLANGTELRLRDYQNKKIFLFFISPAATETDIHFLQQVDSVAGVHQSTEAFIGIRAIENGFSQTSTQAAEPTWYTSYLTKSEAISAPIYAKISSPNQDGLMFWLTHPEANGHFGNDILGAGQIFYIDASGELQGILNPGTKLTDPALKSIFQ